MVAVGGPVGSLCARPTQPAKQRWACVPESSLGSSLRTAGAESREPRAESREPRAESREQLRRGASARPRPLPLLRVVARSLRSHARSLRRSLETLSGIVGGPKGAHGRVPTPGSRGPISRRVPRRFLFPSRGSSLGYSSAPRIDRATGKRESIAHP